MKLLLNVLALGLMPTLCMAKGETPVTGSQASKGFFFMENKGQITDQYYKARPDIDFNLQGKGLTVFVGDGQLHYQFDKLENEAEVEAINTAIKERNKEKLAEVKEYHSSYRMDVELIGANKNAVLVTEDRQSYYEQYYTGSVDANGATVHSYGKVVYKDIYPNIDWVLYTKGGEFKYEFVVREGGNPSSIKLKFSGATAQTIKEDGSLVSATPMGTITDQAPYSFQANGEKVNSSYKLSGDVVSFEVGNYSGVLTIDPTLTWGTYYGGSNTNDFGYSVAVTKNGDASYLAGRTSSTNNIGTVGAHQQNMYNTNPEAFVVKFNADGTRAWGTYYGGESTDYGYGVAIDEGGNVYLCGQTFSTLNIATSGTQQTVVSYTPDAFVVKFNSAGARQWGTYLGGNDYDYGFGIACDLNNDVYVCGYTYSSTNIASAFGFQPSTIAIPDGFLVKYNGSNGVRLWGTYYGSNSDDYAYGVACDRNNNVYLTGYSWNVSGWNQLSTTGAHQTTNYAYYDAYLAKFNSTGTRLWGTYYGGNDYDYGIGVAVNDSGKVYMYGQTYSNVNISSPGAYQTSTGGGLDAFLVKFDSTGVREWGTYFGGNSSESVVYSGIAADGNNAVYFGGYTSSTSGNIGLNGLQTFNAGGTDAFIAKFKGDGTYDWSTYYGGVSTDYGYGLAADLYGNVYLGGRSNSTSGIASNGFQTTNGGGYDAYLAKINDCGIPAQPGTITGNATVCQGSSQTYSVAAVTGATSYTWSLPNGWTGTSTTNSITTVPNASSGIVRVRANVACGGSPWRTLTVNALASPTATITPTGPTTFCDGANVTLNATTGTGLSYVWKNGTTVISGQTTSSYVANTSGNYRVEITNSPNNCTTASAPTSVTVNPNPVINFPSVTPSCNNNPTITLNATPTGGTYTGNGMTGNVFNPITAGTGIHTIVYIYTDNNNCTSGANQSITVNPAPTITFPTLTPVCSDLMVTLNMAQPMGGTYTGTGVVGNTFNPGISGAGTFNVTYTYTDGNNCTNSAVQPQTIYAATPINFPSLSAVCVDAPAVTLNATPAGGTYSGAGTGGTQFTPSVAGTGTHMLHYTYTNNNNCTTHDSEAIVVNALPVVTFPPMTPTCDNALVTMQGAPIGGVYTGPGTGTGTILDPSISGPGTHNIVYTYTDGNTCVNSATQTIDVHPHPVITAQPFLFLEICEDETLGVNVAAQNVGTYQWQHYSVNIPNANSATYLYPNATPAQSGNYQVVIHGAGACSTTVITSGTAAILVNENPDATITPMSAAICQGDTVSISSGNMPGMDFQWVKNGINISNATSGSYVVSDSGSYSIIITDYNTGCFSASGNAVVTVNPLPQMPVITVMNSFGLMSAPAGYASYQWNNNGTPISGATSQTYTATSNGSFTVTVKDTNGCAATSLTSDPLDVNTVITAASGNFTLYPNPNTGAFTISGDVKATNGKVSLEIVDATGKLVYKEQTKVAGDKLTQQIDISSVAAGMYILKVVGESATESIPFVKR